MKLEGRLQEPESAILSVRPAAQLSKKPKNRELDKDYLPGVLANLRASTRLEKGFCKTNNILCNLGVRADMIRLCSSQ